jgi:hypothetical protein
MTGDLFNMFWHGGALSPLQRACMQSFIAHGHRLRVHTYDEVDLPRGVETADAREVLPRDRLFLFEGSPAPFADIFRYKLLFEDGGWWVDSDVLCRKADVPACDYYWAEQEPGDLNNAILKFPRHDPLCARLLQLGQQRAGRLTRWGQTGPAVVSEVLPKSPPAGHAGSTEDAYPIHWLQTHFFWVPGLASAVEARTRGSTFVHFWHSQFARMGMNLNAPPPKGSYLDALYASYGVTIPQPAHERSTGDAIDAMMQYLQQDWVMAYWTDKLGRDAAGLELQMIKRWGSI